MFRIDADVDTITGFWTPLSCSHHLGEGQGGRPLSPATPPQTCRWGPPASPGPLPGPSLALGSSSCR